MVSVSGIEIKAGRIFAVVGLLIGGTLLYIYHGSGRSNAAPTNDLKPPEDKSAERENGIHSFELEPPFRYCKKITYIDNEMTDPQHTVVLMHGAKFDQANWVNIKTMEKLTEWKSRAVALNMKDADPCLVDSADKDKLWNQTMRAEALKQIFQKLDINNLVLVSPSKSGEISLPYLLSKRTDLPKLSGYIPIAPVIEVKYKDKNSGKSEVPILYFYGSKDQTYGPSGKEFFGDKDRFSKAQIEEIADAGHACYIERPDKWHEKLQEFLKKVN